MPDDIAPTDDSHAPRPPREQTNYRRQLARHDWVLIENLAAASQALQLATDLAVCRCGAEKGLVIVGDYVLPPPEGMPSRDFQTLHFDFGVPITPSGPRDVGCLSALHVPRERAGACALTRLVPLRQLLAQRPWPPPAELLRRLDIYGQTRGAPVAAIDYVEGGLARIIDGADARAELPSLRADPGFLCGTEFASLEEELAFFTRHGLFPDEVELRIQIPPGALLVFDNLAFAHGRTGVRQPGELRQWVFGHRQVSIEAQPRFRDRLLEAFAVASAS